jgi:hypothetical protein
MILESGEDEDCDLSASPILGQYIRSKWIHRSDCGDLLKNKDFNHVLQYKNEPCTVLQVHEAVAGLLELNLEAETQNPFPLQLA